MTNQERLKTHTVFVDTVIRECALMTIQREADRLKIEELEQQVADQAESIASLESHSYAREDFDEQIAVKNELKAAKRDIAYLMAGGDPCKVCAKKVCNMGEPCHPVWKGGAEE